MPLLFLIAGLLLIITVIRGTTIDFASRLRTDVSGGFLKWLAAIVLIGALGYARPLQEPSRYLLALIAIVILLSNGGGFVSMFAQQISGAGSQPVTPATPAGGNSNLPAIPIQTGNGTASSIPGGGSASGGGVSPLGAVSALSSVLPFL